MPFAETVKEIYMGKQEKEFSEIIPLKFFYMDPDTGNVYKNVKDLKGANMKFR